VELRLAEGVLTVHRNVGFVCVSEVAVLKRFVRPVNSMYIGNFHY